MQPIFCTAALLMIRPIALAWLLAALLPSCFFLPLRKIGCPLQFLHIVLFASGERQRECEGKVGKSSGVIYSCSPASGC